MLTLTIRTDNAAFDGTDLAYEVQRILKAQADKIGYSLVNGRADGAPIRDVNGNKVGEWRYEPGE